MSVQEFMEAMFDAMPEFFTSEDELRRLWSHPVTRQKFLDKIAELGYTKENLEALQRVIDAENSDLFDVLSYVSFNLPPISRTARVEQSKDRIFEGYDATHKDFMQFVLTKYSEKGVEELGEDKLSLLLTLKYRAIADAKRTLGNVDRIRSMFYTLQQKLYARAA
jgi:type I restriction enzyme R subunit